MLRSMKWVGGAVCAAVISLTPGVAGSAVAGHPHHKGHHHHGHHHHKHVHHKPHVNWHVPAVKWVAPPTVYVRPTSCVQPPPVTCVQPPPPVTCVQAPPPCVQTPVITPCSQVAAAAPAAAEANELPEFEGAGMTIVNAEKRVVSFTVDGQRYKLEPGFQMKLDSKTTYTVIFDKGGKFGQGKYAVLDGKKYRFRVSSASGWDLKETRGLVADTTVAAAPANELP